MIRLDMTSYELVVYERLGLENPYAFALKQIQWNLSRTSVSVLGPQRAIDEAFHGTGRTTQMLISLLVAALRGQQCVLVTAWSSSVAEAYLSQLHVWTRQLGRLPEELDIELRPCQRKSTNPPDPHTPATPDGKTLFYDHFRDLRS